MADSDTLPTATRVSDPGIRALYRLENRWQAWLDVEAALAVAQSTVGEIPRDAAEAITAACRLDRIDAVAVSDAAELGGVAVIGLVEQLRGAVGGDAAGFVRRDAESHRRFSARAYSASRPPLESRAARVVPCGSRGFPQPSGIVEEPCGL